MRKGFVTFVQGGLIRVKCGVMYVDNLTQANFALEGDRVKTRSVRTRPISVTAYRVYTWGCDNSTPIIVLRTYFHYHKTNIHVS